MRLFKLNVDSSVSKEVIRKKARASSKPYLPS